MRHLPDNVDADSHTDPTSRRFFGLSPDHVLDVLEQGGLRPTGQFQQLNSLENRVFSVQVEPSDLAQLCPVLTVADTGIALDRVVIKIYRPGRWSGDQSKAEHDFLHELAQGGLPVAEPLGLIESDDMFHAIWPAMQGRIPDEFSDSLLATFGHSLARLHAIGEQGIAPMRPQLSADHLIRRPLAFLENSGLVPGRVWPSYQRAAEIAASGLEASLRSLPVHRIHGDCHWGNLLARGEKLLFLDFDDFMIGPAVQDLWMIAPAQDEEGARQRRIVLEAYRSLRPFPEAWLQAVNPLKAGRYIHYATWVARRWADPAFPVAFPHFGDLEYWETELRDLEQLIQRGFAPLPGEDKPALEGEDWSHLTNKDYFFDM